MKLRELRDLMDMLSPDCEVVVLPPEGPPQRRPIGFTAPQTEMKPQVDIEKYIHRVD